MPDVRALVSGHDLNLFDGAYLERADRKYTPWEDRLRAWLDRLPRFERYRQRAFVHATNALEGQARSSSSDHLCESLREIAGRMHSAGFSDPFMAEAFALVREAARRTLGMRHHDVQLLAGRALLRGQLAEMSTGEGKTLAATLAACTAAATGAAVHIVTVNDYLAERDAIKNRPLFDAFGLTVSSVLQDMQVPQRRDAYAHDITYVSNKELAFDYLKDQIALGELSRTHQLLRDTLDDHHAEPGILRGLHVAIIDEADSVLIDEASTPLIISETLPDDLDASIYAASIELAKSLRKGTDYIVGNHKDVWLTRTGKTAVRDAMANRGGIWKSPLWRNELLQKALSAVCCFHLDQHYILADDKVQIVDESTGRVMPDRTWERGLHQMIESKEGCEITGQRRTLAQITYQRFFGRYLLLCGMTGTAREVAAEVKRSYGLSVTRIPTHKPSRRKRLPDHICADSESRWQLVASSARSMAANGRAVLIGTRSVEASERLSTLLANDGTQHTVLNARQDQNEADDVAQAGLPGRITVATNMAGRGTDIELSEEVEQRGGLHVILTEFHDTARVDRQLFGRCARQGDPGTTEAIVAVDDDLFARFASSIGRWAMRRLVHSHRKSRWLLRKWVACVQWRSEWHFRRQRMETMRRDAEWVKALGFVGKTRR